MASEPVREPNFVEAKKIKPEFAGFIVDFGSLGKKEVTVTLIDLTLRNYLEISGNRVFVTKKKSGLAEFEKKFIAKLFGESESLSFDEVARKAYRDSFSSLIKIIFRGMIEDGLIDPEWQKKTAAQFRLFPLPKLVKRALSWFFKSSISVFLVCVSLVLGCWFLMFSRLLFSGNATDVYISVFLLIVMVSFSLFIIKTSNKQRFRDYALMLTDDAWRRSYELFKLKTFMEKFPLIEDRLANELVGYAIAFGIGDEWMRRLGAKNAFAGLQEFYSTYTDPTPKIIDFDTYIDDLFS